jgi:hypothetical protein
MERQSTFRSLNTESGMRPLVVTRFHTKEKKGQEL